MDDRLLAGFSYCLAQFINCDLLLFKLDSHSVCHKINFYREDSGSPVVLWNKSLDSS